MTQQQTYDVIVAGGGTAGVAAAIAAARKGAKTLVIERWGHLGGTAVYGIPFLGAFSGNGQQVSAGLFQEIVDRLIAEGGSPGHSRGSRWTTEPDYEFSLTSFDPEVYKYVAQEMVLEAGAEILYHTFISEVAVEKGAVVGAEVANKSGKSRRQARVFVDATGDADLATMAGVPSQSKERLQNVSILFRLGNVDLERFVEALKKGERVKGWGEWHTRLLKGSKIDKKTDTYVHVAGHFKPWDDRDKEITFTAVSFRDGEISLNATRTTHIDGANAADLSKGEISERKNVWEVYRALKQYVPGFSQSYLISTAPLGIRESRNIIGDYTLTKEDVVGARNFEDGIARGSYPIDIHDPAGGRTKFYFIAGGKSYNIPYRCLLPQGIEGLLVAGRSISATHEAMGSVRLMACVTCQGQAAGMAGALAAQKKIFPRQLDVKELQQSLLQAGAIL